MAETRRPTLSLLLLVVVMVVWGGTYVVTKGGLEELPPMLFALLRFCVASVFLMPIVFLRRGRAGPSEPLPWVTLLLMALTGVALYYVAFNLALSYTSASQGALVQSSIPVATAVMAVLWLGERVPPRRRQPLDVRERGRVGRVHDAGQAHRGQGSPDRHRRRLRPGRGPAGPGGPGRGHAPGMAVDLALRLAPDRVPGGGRFGRRLRPLQPRAARPGGQPGGGLHQPRPVIGVVSGVVLLGETVTPLALLGGALVLAGLWMSTSTARPKDGYH